jgi:hypothetical protein
MMATLAVPRRSPIKLPLVSELLERQRTLTLYAAALLMLALLTATAQAFDDRLLNGVSVWMKPTKFLVSVAVFAATAAWFFGYVRPERRHSLLMRRTVAVLILAGSFELAWIAWQASQGLESHFNTGTLFYAIMYALMGLFALLLTATVLPLAWEIGRRPAEGLRPDLRAALVTGLVLTFILGAGMGGYMSAQPGHAVGIESGRVPFFGWNRSGGDLRIAHFLGIHAEQAIPLLAALGGVARLSQRTRWNVLVGGTAIYVLVTLGVFAQAVAGEPLLPL